MDEDDYTTVFRAAEYLVEALKDAIYGPLPEARTEEAIEANRRTAEAHEFAPALVAAEALLSLLEWPS